MTVYGRFCFVTLWCVVFVALAFDGFKRDAIHNQRGAGALDAFGARWIGLRTTIRVSPISCVAA